MAVVMVGFIALGAVYLIVAIQESWPVEVLLLGTSACDISGTWVVFNMVVYSYVADVTNPKNRTKRMGILDFCWYIGSPLGSLLGGWLYKYAGYAAVFGTSTVLWSICLLYVIFIVKESRPRSTEEETGNLRAKCGPLQNVISMFNTGIKKRQGNARLHLFVLTGLKLCVILIQGHMVYQWSRVVLQWDATQYSIFATADSLIHQVGMVGWVWFAERMFLHDCTTLTGGIISIMLWSIVFACITNPQMWWMVIIASFLGMLEGCMEPAIRSLMTIISGPAEAGRILALLSLLDALMLAVDSSIYTALYNSFIETFIQINFVVQASVALSLIPVVLLLRRSMKKNPMTDEETHND